MERIFLIDGHAQIFRMYYAFMSHPLINSKGENTSILYGFAKMVLELIEREHPTHLAVVFDTHAETFRSKVYAEYKANRPPAPELVIEALEPLQEILKALNISVVMVDGVEADDVIGSMAEQWNSPDRKIYMVTPDKDYGQLIGENVFQYKIPKGGEGHPEVIGTKEICAHYGISSPRSVCDILAIWGDTSDNVPGVKGIGEVGAKKLIGQYGTVDNLLAHIDSLPAKQQEKIRASSDMLKMSRFLVTIKRDVSLPVAPDEIKVAEPDMRAVDAVFGRYEMNSLKKLLHSKVGSEGIGDDFSQEILEDYPADTTLAGVPECDECTAEEIEKRARATGECYIGIIGDETLFVSALAEGSTLTTPKAIAYVCKGMVGSDASERKIITQLLKAEDVAKVGADLKKVCEAIVKVWGTPLCGELYDVGLMHYLIDPELSHSVEFMLSEQFGIEPTAFEESNNNQLSDLFSGDEQELTESISKEKKRGALCLYLKERLLTRLLSEEDVPKSSNRGELYTKVEMPLISTLAKMELCGVKIDTEQLTLLSQLLTAQLVDIEGKARNLADAPAINLSSPKQVGELLFEKLKLDADIKKNSKGNYPTDEATLLSLKGKHPIVGEILEYRNLKKLISTYTDALPLLADENGRVHTTFNQALTATGRLSSNNPNLQNIPVRTERGREIRKAFVPTNPEGFILSADYSQIELRLMAHLSGDEGLIAAFNEGEDIHVATASRLFGVEPAEVTDGQRRNAKTVNFGIIYGISPFGLAERLGITNHEAKEFINLYFATYPGISRYISEVVAMARKSGYVETIYGRRRYLREINSRNAIVRKYNERNAVNAPIQGSAADIIKIAMVNVSRRLQRENLYSRMVLQVHDELVFDVVPEERDIILRIAKEEMESVVKLKVPLIVDCGYGKNWLEAH